MAVLNHVFLGLSEDQRQRVDTWLAEFDLSWTPESLKRWADRLPPAGDPVRLAALIEMVKIDLERQWERGEPRTVETYLETYGELGSRRPCPRIYFRRSSKCATRSVCRLG